MNLNQEQLIIFKTVMEMGSFSAAARHLSKVPSAVSMSISNLEIDLNLQLFERVGREPIPTAQAHFLYEKTNQLLIEMNQWKRQAQSLSQGLEISLNIVVVSELLHIDWTHYIEVLEQQFPQLQINIFSAPQEDANKMLLNGQAQFALMFEREQLQGNEQFIELKQTALIPVSAHDYPLAQFDLVNFEQLQHYRQIVVASRDSNIKPELLFSKNYWRTDHHQSACALILKKLGWGILPIEMLRENPILGRRLKVLALQDFTPKFNYFVDLVWNRERALGSAAQFLIEYVKNERKTAPEP